MVVAAENARIRIAEIAGDAGADRDRESGLDKARRLLDMDLQKGPDPAGVEAALAAPQRLGIAATAPDMVGEGAAGIDAFGLQRALGQRPEGAAAADIGDLEPDALLRAHPHHRQVAPRGHAQSPERSQRDETRHHAGRAVEIAAMGHAVEMRAHQDRRGRRIAAAPGRIGVERRVGGHCEPRRCGGLREDAVAEILARAIGVAHDAGVSGAALGQPRKEALGEAALRRDGGRQSLRRDRKHRLLRLWRGGRWHGGILVGCLVRALPHGSVADASQHCGSTCGQAMSTTGQMPP